MVKERRLPPLPWWVTEHLRDPDSANIYPKNGGNGSGGARAGSGSDRSASSGKAVPSMGTMASAGVSSSGGWDFVFAQRDDYDDHDLGLVSQRIRVV